MKNILEKIVIILLSIGVLVVLGIISLTQGLTARESSLLGFILSVLSIIVSYLISDHFAKQSQKEAIETVKEQHTENLKIYAVNAAEKVNNLSNELKRLTEYLEEELDREYSELQIDLHSKVERIESAIHIINSLKSVNDTYLSDWRGVIPETINEIYEEKEEREVQLQNLIEKATEVIENAHPINDENNEVKKEIYQLKNEIALALKRVGGVNIRPLRVGKRPVKQAIQKKCEHCGTELIYRQRPMASSYKIVTCSKCSIRYNSMWDDTKGFYLIEEEMHKEKVKCPCCKNMTEALLSNMIGTTSRFECSNCGSLIQVNVNRNDQRVILIKSEADKEKPIIVNTDEYLEKVRNELPQQPWPKDIHKSIALKLGISNGIVWKIINDLINKGEFFPQINGIVYKPEKKKKSNN